MDPFVEITLIIPLHRRSQNACIRFFPIVSHEFKSPFPKLKERSKKEQKCLRNDVHGIRVHVFTYELRKLIFLFFRPVTFFTALIFKL